MRKILTSSISRESSVWFHILTTHCGQRHSLVVAAITIPSNVHQPLPGTASPPLLLPLSISGIRNAIATENRGLNRWCFSNFIYAILYFDLTSLVSFYERIPSLFSVAFLFSLAEVKKKLNGENTLYPGKYSHICILTFTI